VVCITPVVLITAWVVPVEATRVVPVDAPAAPVTRSTTSPIASGGPRIHWRPRAFPAYIPRRRPVFARGAGGAP